MMANPESKNRVAIALEIPDYYLPALIAIGKNWHTWKALTDRLSDVIVREVCNFADFGNKHDAAFNVIWSDGVIEEATINGVIMINHDAFEALIEKEERLS